MAKKPDEIELSQGNNLYVLGVTLHTPSGKATNVGGCCTYGNVNLANVHEMWRILDTPEAQAIMAEANAKMGALLSNYGKLRNLKDEIEG